MAVQGIAKPSVATSAPSSDITTAGAGDSATIEAPPVDADGSTDSGADTFRVSVESRTAVDWAVNVLPLTAQGSWGKGMYVRRVAYAGG